MEQVFCQSCGMPMQTDQDHGKNADNTLNEDYCCYCYNNGGFAKDCTMDEMIDQCVGFLDEFNNGSQQKMTKEQAIAQMKEFFPHLKRWAKA